MTKLSIKSILPEPFNMIKIPEGSVTVKDKTEIIPVFEIAKYPVTNAQFAKFMDAKGYENQDWWTDAGWDIRKKEKWTEPRNWQDSQWNGKRQPVVGVSWYEAAAFCLWLTAVTGDKVMLPTEQQWQRAAQALPDGRDSAYLYPWGNDWDCERCNNSVKPCASDVTTPVTQYEGKGDSQCGVVDMAGNVWEWYRKAYESGSQEPKGTGTRGGAYHNSHPSHFRMDLPNSLNPENRNVNKGFRFAFSL